MMGCARCRTCYTCDDSKIHFIFYLFLHTINNAPPPAASLIRPLIYGASRLVPHSQIWFFYIQIFFLTCEKWGFVCITIGAVCARGCSHKLGQGQEQRTASRTQQYLSVCLFAKMRENFLCAWAKSDSTQRLLAYVEKQSAFRDAK